MSRNVKLDLKMQIPRMKCRGVSFDKMELVCETSPVNEDEYKHHAKFPWTPVLQDGILRVRIDERTQFFDSKSELILSEDAPNVSGRDVTCIIEVTSVYNFKERSGLSIRAHQVKIHTPECLFDF